MLRRDTAACFEGAGFWLFKRYHFVSGDIRGASSFSRGEHDALMHEQQTNPVRVVTDEARRRTWWLFEGEFYWEDEGYEAVAVKALLLQRKNQRERRIERAIALMDGAAAAESPARAPIPDEVRAFVWQRDGGRCVRCGSQERLEFDHVIPLALGGANTARNLQLLCETCNRQKGAAIS